MLRHRIIPVLLMDETGMVKTTKFRNRRYLGDPVNIARLFNDKGVDELVVLDIDATKRARSPDYDTIREVASQCFMPFAYGGGVSNVETAHQVFECGVEKVVVKTLALSDPDVVSVICRTFGSQAVAASLDLARDWRGRPTVYAPGSAGHGSRNWTQVLSSFEALGVGEILLNSVHRDGTRTGLDLELVAAASRLTSVPLTALGGIGSVDDIRDGIRHGADAVAAGSFFVFQGTREAVLISYPSRDTLDSLHEEGPIHDG